jgi:hypothetical protein
VTLKSRPAALDHPSSWQGISAVSSA